MPYVGKKPADIIATAVDTTTGTFSGVVDADAGITVDNITIDGTEIDLSSGDLTIDSAGDIILDADGSDIIFKDGGTDFGRIKQSSSDLIIRAGVQDKDIKLQGDDGGSAITALQLDMSANGKAFFSDSVALSDGKAFIAGGDADLQIYHTNGGANHIYGQTAHHIDFSTSDTFRMRLKDDGNFLIGTTVNGTTAQGIVLRGDGESMVTRNNATPFLINRAGNDGGLIEFRQGNSAEGTISVSGSTVSYNAFSGSHWSRLADNSKPTILKGTIIETIDEMCDWYQAEFIIPATTMKNKEGEDVEDTPEITEKISIALPDGKSVGDIISYTHEGITYNNAKILKEDDNKHAKCKISDTADSKRVYGVFADWDADDDVVNDMYVTAIGTHVVRINKDVTVSAGDLLSSNGDGTAKVQDDDIIRSKTIGKVLTNIKQETYDDGSYTVPCALYCG